MTLSTTSLLCLAIAFGAVFSLGLFTGWQLAQADRVRVKRGSVLRYWWGS